MDRTLLDSTKHANKQTLRTSRAWVRTSRTERLRSVLLGRTKIKKLCVVLEEMQLLSDLLANPLAFRWHDPSQSRFQTNSKRSNLANLEKDTLQARACEPITERTAPRPSANSETTTRTFDEVRAMLARRKAVQSHRGYSSGTHRFLTSKTMPAI